MRKLYFILLITLCSTNLLFAQQIIDSARFEIGKPCPDFVLKNVDYYSKEKASLGDFKGKWLVLDFWSKVCVYCVESFPKLNKMQQEFKDQVQIFLIGNNTIKYNQGIKKMFDRINGYQELDLPIAYDSVMFERFKVQITPSIVVIDPQGIVRALPAAALFNSAYLKSVINGGQIADKSDEVDTHMVLNASILSRWGKGTRIALCYKLDKYIKNSMYRTTCTSLGRLYNIAFWGETEWTYGNPLYAEVWSKPLLELKDSTLFSVDFYKQMGLYDYEIKVEPSKANSKYIKFALQCDLKKQFGYEVSIEKRLMPCLNLVATKAALTNLPTKGAETSKKGDVSGVTYTNVKLERVLQALLAYSDFKYPLIDKTGIVANIDIEINANLTDFEQVKKNLKMHGLELKPDVKEMSVIVIKDGDSRF